MGVDRTSTAEEQLTAVPKSLAAQAPVADDQLSTIIDHSVDQLIHGPADTAEQAALFLALVSGESPELLVGSLDRILGYDGHPRTVRSLLYAVGNIGRAYPHHVDAIRQYVERHTDGADQAVRRAAEQVLADLDSVDHRQQPNTE